MNFCPWHSWIARETPTLKAAGSNPVGQAKTRKEVLVTSFFVLLLQMEGFERLVVNFAPGERKSKPDRNGLRPWRIQSCLRNQNAKTHPKGCVFCISIRRQVVSMISGYEVDERSSLGLARYRRRWRMKVPCEYRRGRKNRG